MKKKLFVLSAPSGTGKTSVCKELLKINPKWKFSISATTRAPRPKEIEGKDYIFLDDSKFKHYIQFGDFLEWEWVHGNKYGTLLEPIEDAIDKNETMLLDIDFKGGLSVIEEFPDETYSIFLEPPGENMADKLMILEERLMARGETNSTLIKQRLKRFHVEIEYKEKFDFSIVNDDFKKVVKKIDAKIKENL